MDNYVSIDNCPVCNSNSYRIIKRKAKFKFKLCNICSLIYISPRITNIQNVYTDNKSSSPSKYYELSYKYDNEIFNKRIDLIEEFSPKGNILDIGSSTGTLIEIAELRGWKALGVEPNPVAYEISKNKKLNVYNGFFEKPFADTVKSNFEAAYMGDVLEHVPDPVKMIDLALQTLKIDGVLMIVTPNFDSIVARMFQIKPVEHILYFTQNSLKYLLAKFDLKIELMKNITRKRSLNALPYSTTFSDKPLLRFILKTISSIGLDPLINTFLTLFIRDEILVIIRKAGPLK